MKKLSVVLLFVLFVGCGENPINTDNTEKSKTAETYPTICITTNTESSIYEYSKIFSDGVFLNITFPKCTNGECGVSIECNSIIYYETFSGTK